MTKPRLAELLERSLRDGRNHRIIEEDGDLHDLARSISRQGFLASLGGIDDGDFVTLLWGHRRLAAYRLGLRDGLTMPEFIPVSLYPDTLTEEEAEILTLSENLQRSELTEIEIYQAVKSFSDRGLTLDEIGELLHRHKSTISKYQAPDRIPLEAKAFFLASRLSLGDCYRIATAADPLAAMNALLGGKRPPKLPVDGADKPETGPTRITIPLPSGGKDKPSPGVVTISTKGGQPIGLELVQSLLREAMRLAKEAERQGLSIKSATAGWKDIAYPKAMAETAS